MNFKAGYMNVKPPPQGIGLSFCGLSQSALIRQLCKGKAPKPQPQKEFWELLNALYDIHNSIACVENPEKTKAENLNLQPLRDVFSYVSCPEATEQGEYVFAVNCLKEIALQQMILWTPEHIQRTMGAYASFGNRRATITYPPQMPQSLWDWFKPFQKTSHIQLLLSLKYKSLGAPSLRRVPQWTSFCLEFSYNFE